MSTVGSDPSPAPPDDAPVILIVEDNELRWVGPRARFATAIAVLHAGERERAEEIVDAAYDDAWAMRMWPDALSIRRTAAEIFAMMGHAEQAGAQRAHAATAVVEIASLFKDPELRSAYLKTNAVG